MNCRLWSQVIADPLISVWLRECHHHELEPKIRHMLQVLLPKCKKRSRYILNHIKDITGDGASGSRHSYMEPIETEGDAFTAEGSACTALAEMIVHGAGWAAPEAEAAT